MKYTEFSDLQSRAIEKNLLRPSASQNFLLKLYDMNQWIFLLLLLVPIQFVNNLYRCLSLGQPENQLSKLKVIRPEVSPLSKLFSLIQTPLRSMTEPQPHPHTTGYKTTTCHLNCLNKLLCIGCSHNGHSTCSSMCTIGVFHLIILGIY